jgi:hypothetical protein
MPTRTAVVCYGWEFNYQQDDGSSVQIQEFLDRFMRDEFEHRPVNHHLINLVELLPNPPQRPAAQWLSGICPCWTDLNLKPLMESVAASVSEEAATKHHRA